VADRLGIGGRLPQRRDEELGGSHCLCATTGAGPLRPSSGRPAWPA
jgi:hypothetical protein